MFRKYQTTAEVFRPWYTTQNGYKKSGYVTTSKTYLWHLKAQGINKIIDLAMFWKVYAFHTDINADIKEWDRLKIKTVDYDVKGVSDFDGITFKIKQILLNRV